MYDSNNKNLLLRVFDATPNTQGFKDDTNGSDINIDINQAPDYAYDANGNMISDTNKGITQIKYNHLNLPTQIIFVNENKISYLYNATGQKVNKVVTEKILAQTIITTTDYLTGFQYKNTVLQFFPHAEGYVNASQNGTSYTFNYVFNYTDHLGNIRLSYSKDPTSNVLKIIEENHYYPFGLKHSGYNSDRYYIATKPKRGDIAGITFLPFNPADFNSKNVYNYKYNGKEFQDELGLNVYDYDNRIYDQAIGRFWQMDPLAEQGRRWSPYNYCFDNPIYFQDPDGMWPKLPSWNDVKQAYRETKASVVSNYNQTKASITKTYNETKSSVTKTYNETKASVTKTYNETKKTVVETTNKVVASTKETLNEGKQWVKENKGEIMLTAKELQRNGDNMTTAGLVVAAAGAPIAGVGATPGLTAASIGGVTSLTGTMLEIGVNFLSGDVEAGSAEGAAFFTGKLAEMALDKAVPGPNPSIGPEVTEALKVGQEAVKNTTSNQTSAAVKKVLE